MKLCLLTLVLVGASVAARAEDCPLILNQRFQLHYNQWQSNQAPTMATTQAVYEVDAGVPVFTYRLGALALNGALEYNRLAYGDATDSDAGISRYGARLSLFPYRPFRLYLDYQHSQSPDLFDSGRVKGDTWGAGVTYHSRILQDVRLSYRHGDSKLGDEREDWSQWKLEANQRVGGTQVTFQSLRQDYETRIPGQGWRYFQANLDTETHSAADWTLRTRSQFQDSISSSWFDLGATFYGPISGAWHSLTNASAGASTAGDTRTGHTFASESLVYAAGRWNAYGTGAMSRTLTDAAGQDTRMDSGTLGGTYTLTQDWRIHGDVGVSAFEQGLPNLTLRRTTTTMNLGIARGGDVPELIRHTLFFLSDWTFTRRTRDEYPPDYVPSELAQELFQRRMRQSGNFGFTADLWRISDNASQGRVDWARVTGQVQTRGRLTLYMAGDYKDDRGLSQPGVDARNTDLMMNGSYQLGITSITASAGYSSNSQRLTPGAATSMTTWTGAQDESSRHYSLGVTTRLGKVPVGALAQRFDAVLTPAATTLYTWADFSFRQVSLRVRYETTRMDNGLRSSRVTVDLLRWFDTICSRSWR
ncbi:hypothetical protein [Geothrix mesophila]|uniref:hypothetical protein n=1 Tax=Geothrix mesophila TaxID=2922723 RepID=UPI001FADDFF5|nr:hypothetical protein [Geothrix sp. SG198]